MRQVANIERRDTGPAWRDAAGNHGYDDAGDARRWIQQQTLLRHAFHGDLTQRVKCTEAAEHGSQLAPLAYWLAVVARPDGFADREVQRIEALLAAARRGRASAVKLVQHLILRFVWPEFEVAS